MLPHMLPVHAATVRVTPPYPIRGSMAKDCAGPRTFVAGRASALPWNPADAAFAAEPSDRDARGSAEACAGLALRLHDCAGAAMIASMEPSARRKDAADGRRPARSSGGTPPARRASARAGARASRESRFAAADGRTRLDRLYQSGSAKVRLPRVGTGEPLQAILINTAGGITGGDQLDYEVAVGDGAGAVVTTQAAERIYRRATGTAPIETTITVGAGGRLDWLPQETILFDRSSLTRRLAADVDETGSLLAVEAVVLGRAAMGEAVREASLNDVWRIRRGGRLVFADGIRLDGDARAIMAGRATGNGAAAFATVVLVAPDAAAAARPGAGGAVGGGRRSRGDRLERRPRGAAPRRGRPGACGAISSVLWKLCAAQPCRASGTAEGGHEFHATRKGQAPHRHGRAWSPGGGSSAASSSTTPRRSR